MCSQLQATAANLSLLYHNKILRGIIIVALRPLELSSNYSSRVSVPDLIVALGASGLAARGPKYFDFRISYPARRVLTFIVLYIAFTTLLADNINKIVVV